MLQNEHKKLFCGSASISSDSASLCADMEIGDGAFMLVFKELDFEENSLSLSLLMLLFLLLVLLLFTIAFLYIFQKVLITHGIYFQFIEVHT